MRTDDGTEKSGIIKKATMHLKSFLDAYKIVRGTVQETLNTLLDEGGSQAPTYRRNQMGTETIFEDGPT